MRSSGRNRRSRPGSRVQSSRGALREIPLRFRRTLLMMPPTPAGPCGRCRPAARGLLPAGSRSCLIPETGRSDRTLRSSSAAALTNRSPSGTEPSRTVQAGSGSEALLPHKQEPGPNNLPVPVPVRFRGASEEMRRKWWMLLMLHSSSSSSSSALTSPGGGVGTEDRGASGGPVRFGL